MADQPNAEKPCPRLAENKKHCTCPSADCPRHGKCCACVLFHRERGNAPMCLR